MKFSDSKRNPKDYKFRLGKQVTICPKCHRRTFKPFVDDNGIILDLSVGRCNRENHCGYFVPPREYFAIHTTEIPFSNPMRAIVPTAKPAVPPGLYSRDMMDKSVERGVWSVNNMSRYLLTHYSSAVVEKVCEWLKVGSARKGMDRTIFWMVDRFNCVRGGKLMAYDRNARRRKDVRDSVRWVHNYPETRYYLLNPTLPYVFRTCYFGSYLPADFTGTVYLVESEKTAVALACHMEKRGKYLTECAVMATGGASNLQFYDEDIEDPYHRIAALRNRNVVLIPDADAVEKWQEYVDRLKKVCKSVSLLDLRDKYIGPSDDPMDLLEAYGAW